MMTKFYSFVFILTCFNITSFTQSITYSEPDRNDLKQTEFEIIGKVKNNILVYKNLRDNHAISVYDTDMKQLGRIKFSFLPDKLINTDFIVYNDFAFMIYQYQKKNIVYCMAVKIGPDGNKINEPFELDTTQISYWASNKFYSFVNSDNKQNVALIKVNSRNDKLHIVTICSFNTDLKLLQKVQMPLSMPQRFDYLSEFQIDNLGNVAFLKTAQNSQNDNINKLSIIIKPALAETYAEYDINLNNVYLDEVKLKSDNVNNKYLITSFYSKARRGNVEGLYTNIWDVSKVSTTTTALIPLGDEIRKEAKTESSTRTAFNDFFLRNIIIKKDGGFILVTESFYTSSRGGTYNRWDYLFGSPYSYGSDYYMWNPYGYSYPWSRWNNNNRQQIRYHAENIAVFSFDNTANLLWTNVINKTQYNDESDGYIGYQLINTGDQIHFLFNQEERRSNLLTDQSIAPGGQITRNPTIKNLDRGYDFMPRYGKQVGLRTTIFPCMYRNYICFAKVEL